MYYRCTPTNAIVIPFYIYPSSASVWAPVIEVARANPGARIIAIINPGSGPGSTIDLNYVACAAALKAAGVIVWGYVATNYGVTAQATIQAQILLWQQWYGPSGLFIDEMNNVTGSEAYYTALSSYARTLGMQTVMGNPGTTTIASYIGTVDVLNIYESAGLPTIANLTNITGYPRANWSYIAYTVSSITTAALQALAPYVAYAYVNDDVTYATLPSYFSAEVAAIG